jgi:hypothetical protein
VKSKVLIALAEKMQNGASIEVCYQTIDQALLTAK